MDPIQFEGIKTGLKQSKDGYLLSLAVHPDDLPDNLVRDFVGARYMVVMVRIGDNEKPVNRDQFKRNDPVVSMAGMMCRSPDFWSFIFSTTGDEVTTEGECAEWFKYYFDVESRADLKTNEDARHKFLQFKGKFDEWKK